LVSAAVQQTFNIIIIITIPGFLTNLLGYSINQSINQSIYLTVILANLLLALVFAA